MSVLERARNFLSGRQRAYKLTFGGVAGDTVLQDLAQFCRANESCFHPDARASALMEGRREVWLRIKEHLDLTEEQLTELHIPQQRKIQK
jgi:hypothetical protein